MLAVWQSKANCNLEQTALPVPSKKLCRENSTFT